MRDKAIMLAEVVDAWRLIPRVLVLAMFCLMMKVVLWYMALDVRGFEESGFVAVMTAAFAKLCDFYMKTGRAWLSFQQLP